jgi:hypothetical protein
MKSLNRSDVDKTSARNRSSDPGSGYDAKGLTNLARNVVRSTDPAMRQFSLRQVC